MLCHQYCFFVCLFVCRAFIEFEQPPGMKMSSPLPVLESVHTALWLRHKRNRAYLYLEDPSLHRRRRSSSLASSGAPPTEVIPADEAVIPPLKLPDEGIWQIMVTHVSQHANLKSKPQKYSLI